MAAQRMGLAVTGTIGLLYLAARRGLLGLSETFECLRQTSFRCPNEIMVQLLNRFDREREYAETLASSTAALDLGIPNPRGSKIPIGKKCPPSSGPGRHRESTFGLVPCQWRTTPTSGSRGRSEPMMTKRKRAVHELQKRMKPWRRCGSLRATASENARDSVGFRTFYQTFYQLPHETPQNRVKEEEAK